MTFWGHNPKQNNRILNDKVWTMPQADNHIVCITVHLFTIFISYIHIHSHSQVPRVSVTLKKTFFFCLFGCCILVLSELLIEEYQKFDWDWSNMLGYLSVNKEMLSFNIKVILLLLGIWFLLLTIIFWVKMILWRIISNCP